MMLKSFFHLLLFSCFASTACAQGEQEANLKAAFIYNFTKYIDWNFDATETNENDLNDELADEEGGGEEGGAKDGWCPVFCGTPRVRSPRTWARSWPRPSVLSSSVTC